MTPERSVSLYGHWICPYATRVQFALAQRGIEHDVVDLPPSAVRPAGFVLPREFVEHSPRLEIPMVRIGDEYLADSILILEWLEAEIPTEPLLPTDDEQRAFVRERMVWIDRHVFRPMIGVYYGTDPVRIEAASDALSTALDELAAASGDCDWVSGGAGPSLAEAVLVPVYVRLDGLRALGFTHPLPDPVEAHRRRCAQLTGWSTVAWTTAQTEECVGRFLAHRRKRAATP